MSDRTLLFDGLHVPRFLYGTAWKEDQTQRLTELAGARGSAASTPPTRAATTTFIYARLDRPGTTDCPTGEGRVDSTKVGAGSDTPTHPTGGFLQSGG